MKKSFLLIAATAIIISCTDSNVKENLIPEQAIGFTNNHVGRTTRNAGEINNKTALETDGNTMKVWAWKTNSKNVTSKVFNGVTVTYNTATAQAANSTTGWSYSPIRYWDTESSYDFYAVAPYNKFAIDDATHIITATVAEPVQILNDLNGVDKVTTSTAIDYLVATGVHRDRPKGNASDGDVSFTFSHILSRLAIKVNTSSTFNNTGSTYPQIKLTYFSIWLQGMCPTYTQATAGTVDAAADAWSGTGSSETEYVCFDSSPATAPATNSVTDKLLDASTGNSLTSIADYLVAPTATATTNPVASAATYTYKVSLEYDIYYSSTTGDSEHFIVDKRSITGLTSFVQNTSNTLTVTVDPKAIRFDVDTNSDWTFTSGTSANVEIE